MADLHTDWKPVYEPWQNGGWNVTNVRYPDGSVGCVSGNYPDGKWRIARDQSLTPYPSRDAAARAERTLAYYHHLVAARAVAATRALAMMLLAARWGSEYRQTESSPAEMRRFRAWVEAGRPDADDFACDPCSDAGQAWECNRTRCRDRDVACDGPTVPVIKDKRQPC